MSNHQPVTARSKPYAELPPHMAACKRCGIIREIRASTVSAYCKDCLPEARRLGWAPAKVAKK